MEIADAVLEPEGAQLCGERDQVVIVNPDQIVRPHQSGKGSGESAVDPEVACVIGARKIRQADAVMHGRPKGAVGETAIIFLPVDGC